MQPLMGFLIHGAPSYVLSMEEENLHPLIGSKTSSWERKIESNEDLDPLVRRLGKSTFSYLPSSRRARGLKVRNLRSMVTSLTYGVSDVISSVTMLKTARSIPLKGSETSLRREGFMPLLY